MYTIQKLNQHVQKVALKYIPKKLHHRFSTGVEALSTSELSSLNANGRRLTINRWTGESRMRRCVTDSRFPSLLLNIIIKEYIPKSGQLRLSLDHSTFGIFTVAVLALSAGKGRALPVWCIITRSGKGHPLVRPLLRGIKLLISLFSYQQRKRLIIVMDRWFAIPDLLSYIDSEHVDFIVRLKQNTPVNVPWLETDRTIAAGEVSLNDVDVTYHEHNWRLVQSDIRLGMKSNEPWFLLTNISSSKRTRQQILRTYAKRFEIEELFKDMKWIEGYEWHKIKKLSVARSVFMFVFFGWWMLVRSYGTNKQYPNERKTHPHKQLSWFRTVWEHWLRLRYNPLLL